MALEPWIRGHGFINGGPKQPVTSCHNGWNMVVVSPFFHASVAPILDAAMPSLFRFLTVVGILGGLAYGTMFMLAHWFDPKPREITVSVPADKFSKQR
jgi:hypothetical protein